MYKYLHEIFSNYHEFNSVYCQEEVSVEPLLCLKIFFYSATSKNELNNEDKGYEQRFL